MNIYEDGPMAMLLAKVYLNLIDVKVSFRFVIFC